jgi:alpha-1,2-mannosyltransferase
LNKPRITVIASVVVLVLVGVALGVQSGRKAGFRNPDESDPAARWNDLRVFYGAGRMAFQDIDLYKNPTSPEGRFYIMPPFFAIVSAPLAALGWKTYFVVWFVLSLAAVVAAALLCVKIARPDAAGATLALIAGAALFLSARPIISDFHNGQLNSLIFLLIAFSLYLFVRKPDAASGIVMAVAASIKLTALIFLPYFAFKRAWKTAGGMLLGLVFTIVLLPLVSFGPDRTARLYSSFYAKMVGPFASVSDAPEVYAEAGQSLRAAAGRYLTDANAAHHSETDVRVNFADLSGDTVWKLVLAGCLALTLATALCARADPADPTRRRLAALEFGAVLLLMLMVSPMSRKAHFVVLVLPFTALVNYVLASRADPAREGLRRLALGAVITAFVAYNLTSPDLVGKKASHLLQALSVFLFGTFVLWAASCAIVYRERSIPAPGGSQYLPPLPPLPPSSGG